MEDYIDFEEFRILGVGDKVPEFVIKVYDTVE
ncbi:peroxiredoxin, partial [Candidatus Nanobsidianus stetteri]